MRWKSIIVGVDGSPESMRAVELARNLSTAAGAACYPVYAVRDPWVDMTSSYMAVDLVALNRSLIGAGRARLSAAPKPTMSLMTLLSCTFISNRAFCMW